MNCSLEIELFTINKEKIKMGRNLYHSAEGSHWTKKNHKYIRKEGNRYIYPEDLQKSAVNKQGSKNYKQLSEQHANRQAAKSGKIVNPTYTLRDDQGNKVMRLQSKDKLSTPTVADYKKYSQLTSGAKNRKKMVDNQGSTRNYTVKSGHQLNSTDAKRWGQEQKAITNARLKEKKRQKALNSQGSYKDYEFENGNGQLSQQTAKEMSKWNRNKEGEKAVKRRNAVNKQGSSYDWRRANTIDDAKSWSKEQQKSKGYEIRRSEKDNKKELKKASNRLKKLTNKGYFTVQNGKTVFVPADEATTKKVSKGRQVIDKIKSKFSKKK